MSEALASVPCLRLKAFPVLQIGTHVAKVELTLMGDAVVLPGREDRPDAPGRCRAGSGLRRRRPLERAGPSSSSSLVKLA